MNRWIEKVGQPRPAMNGACWVIFAAGDWCEPSVIERFVSPSTQVIACDGALIRCLDEGLEPTVVIGDMDSVTPEALSVFRAGGGEVIERVNQEHHDLSKALTYARENGAGSCLVFGATGGDEQHTWSNLLTCARSMMDVVCVGPKQIYRFLKPRNEYSIEIEAAAMFSLFALPKAEGIFLSGATYALEDETIVMGSRGLHNQCDSGRVNLSFTEGCLMMMHPHPFVWVEARNEA